MAITAATGAGPATIAGMAGRRARAALTAEAP